MIALMTGGVGCPDENSLVRFSAGQLSGPDLGGIERHLDGCSACRSLIAQLASFGTTEQGNSAASSEARHGRVGRYEVERLVGGGGMGVVYAARDKELNRVVAIKLLRTSALANQESRARLLREAQTMAKLSHPNLVPIFELGSDHGDDFLAMELIDGPTLDVWLRDRKREWRDVVRVFLEAGRGLEAAHQAGVVHRDFKPGNVLIGPDGRARVTDFGLARPRVPELAAGAEGGSIELTREGSLLGTPAYMSPEQLEGRVADVRSDQFGFCVALAEALIGHRPFPGRSLEELRARMRSGTPPDLELEPPRLKRLLLKGMSISPDARFTSMAELLEGLTAVLKPSLAHGRGVAAGMGLAVILAAAAGIAWQQLNRPAPTPAVVAARTTVSLIADQQKTIAVPGIQRLVSFDEKQLAAAVIGNQQVSLTGLAPGQSTLVMQTRAAPHEPIVDVEWDVTVAAPEFQQLHLTVGAEESIIIPGLSRVAVGGPDLLGVATTADNKVVLTPLKPGTTTLLAWRQANEGRLEWRVTIAAPPEDPRVAHQSLRLFRGGQQVLTIPGIQRVAVGDSTIADVKTVGNDQLLVIGAGAGRTTLIVWTEATPFSDQKRREYDVRVDADKPVAVEPTQRKHLELFVGDQQVLTVPGIQRVAIGDNEIADVKTIGNSQLMLIGAGAGTTTLLVWTSAVPPANQKRLEWDVSVAAPNKAAPDTPMLNVGEQKLITIPRIQRFVIGDPSIANVKKIGPNQLLLVGAVRGTTTVLIWTSDQQRRAIQVTVDILKVIPADQAPPNVAVDPESGRKLLTIPRGRQTLLEVAGLARFSVGNSKVMGASAIGNQQVLVVAKERGMSALEAWAELPGQMPAHLEWDVKVE